MNVVLIGYRGSGKTTAGRLLADRLWRPFADLDERIVARAGCSIREIFDQQGEEAFRAMESAELADLLSQDDQIISLGGGAILREHNRSMLAAPTAAARVIYLRCEPDELHRRIHADSATAAARPPLTALGGGIDEITQLLALREPLYRAVANAELDVTHLTPQETVVYLARMV